MVPVAIAGVALLARAPAVLVIAALASTVVSVPISGALIGVAVAVSVLTERRKSRNAEVDEGEVLRRLSGRVTAGATIRSAIADSVDDAVPGQARRLAALGRPMAEVSDELNGVLPVNGAAFRGICSFSEHTGAAISAALSTLAGRADEAAEAARVRRVSLAQVKFSAIVVGVVPVLMSTAILLMRGIPEPGGAAVVAPIAVGVVLQLVGTTIVFRVAARSDTP